MKHALLLFLCLTLAACGFRPMYGQAAKETGTAIPADIVIDPIPGREGQLLRIGLEDRLNPGGQAIQRPRYRLSIVLAKNEIPVVIEKDGTVRRYNVRFDSSYQLIDATSGKQLDKGTVKRMSSYNVTENSDFSTFVSQRDAGERAIAELAEDYRMRLGAFFGKGGR